MDASVSLGKDQSIKIEVPEKEQYLTTEDGKQWRDMGTRDINTRLQMAPNNTYKVLFLENIERMGISAANAFLKSLEEPLPGRIIIATCSSVDHILPTIQSRAMILRTQTPSKPETLGFLAEQYPDIPNNSLELYRTMFQGAIGSIITAIENKTITSLQEQYTTLITTNNTYHKITFNSIKELSKHQGSSYIFDSLLLTGKHDQTTLLKAKKLLSSNINEENILFGYSYRCLESQSFSPRAVDTMS
jgi:DNA polymerase III delta prime subunit